MIMKWMFILLTPMFLAAHFGHTSHWYTGPPIGPNVTQRPWRTTAVTRRDYKQPLRPYLVTLEGQAEGQPKYKIIIGQTYTYQVELKMKF